MALMPTFAFGAFEMRERVDNNRKTSARQHLFT